MTKQFTRWEKLQNVAHRLQAEAYYQQVKAKRGGKLRQFVPCEKGLVFSNACLTSEVFSVIEQRAAYFTPCPCHNSVAELDLMNMEYDDTYRLAHHSGTTWALVSGARR